MAKIAKKTINVEQGSVTFDFGPDSDNPVKSSVIRLSDFSPEMVQRLALHGASQKFGDCYSGAETVEEAIAAHEATVAQVMAGDWKETSTGLGRIDILAYALARVAANTPDSPPATHEARNWQPAVAAMDRKTRKQYREDPAVAKAIADIELERARDKQKAAKGKTGGELDLAGLFQSVGAEN